METCIVCTKKVYPTERVAADTTIYHKSCFRCEQCNGVLKLGSYASMEGRTFCKPCFKKNFFTKGNYSEGFGKLKPQHEHDLKSGKTVGNAASAPDLFDLEKKRQEEEERKRKEELKKKRDDEVSKPAEEKKVEERKDKSEEFRKRQELFEKEKAEEKEKAAQKRKEEERAKLFEETRLRREESVRKLEEDKKTEKKESPVLRTNATTTSTTASTSKSNNIFLKNDAEKKNTSTSSSPVTRSTANDDTKRVKELLDELSDAKKQLSAKDKEIERLETQNRDLKEKLSSAGNVERDTQHKELEEADVSSN